jgi:tetratricopeptide (TPR) repeat protein
LDVDQFIYESRTEASQAEIEHGLSLYTGDLLEDIYDDWCSSEREHLHQLWLANLNRYSQSLQNARRYKDALTILQKWIATETFDEIAHYRLMQVHAQMGDRTRAIQAYFSFAEILRAELGAEPLPETQALLQAIQNGQSLPPIENTNLSSSATRSLGQFAPVISVSPKLPFIGRQNELSILETTYLQALQGSGKFMLVSGESGIGKTRLLEEYLNLHPNAICLQASCYELDSMMPFSPFRQALNNSSILSDLLHNLDKKSPPAWIAPLLPILPELEAYFPEINYHRQRRWLWDNAPGRRAVWLIDD